MIQFIQDHHGVISVAAVAVLDLVFAINPKATSNGVLHWVYLQLGGKPTV